MLATLIKTIPQSLIRNMHISSLLEAILCLLFFLAQRSRNWSYYQVNATLSPQLYSCNGTSPAKPLPFWLSCCFSSHFHLHWEEIKWIHNGFCFLTEQTDIHEVLCNTVMIKYSLNLLNKVCLKHSNIQYLIITAHISKLHL